MNASYSNQSACVTELAVKQNSWDVVLKLGHRVASIRRQRRRYYSGASRGECRRKSAGKTKKIKKRKGGGGAILGARARGARNPLVLPSPRGVPWRRRGPRTAVRGVAVRGVAVPVRAPGRGMRAALVPPLLLRPPVVPLVLLLLVLGGRWTATSSLTAEDDDDAEPEREERALHYRNQPGGGTSSSPSPEDEPEELLIAGFFPTTLNLSEGAIGRGVVPAVNLALRHINSSPHFLPGYKLDIIWNDTKSVRRVPDSSADATSAWLWLARWPLLPVWIEGPLERPRCQSS
ncbi:hypothetical protein HPB49_014865 [Dermacentor silvarum]|uniref:Uncharacterized protein n=1 Tax=Dermacentor silvarum TaxID=543639 RepID=A0ACB8DJ56_DERSI|nr:hypothetical protein HPB49_014865 [Dermacentor silvarum]